MLTNGRLLGLLILLAVCAVLAFSHAAKADPYYDCQFLGHCPDGQVRHYQMDKVGNERAKTKR